MEFKGTKGKWSVNLGEERSLVYSDTYGGILNCPHAGIHKQEHDANAILISKAPEMLGLLNDIDGLLDNGVIVTNEWIHDRVKQLIKEATEL